MVELKVSEQGGASYQPELPWAKEVGSFNKRTPLLILLTRLFKGKALNSEPSKPLQELHLCRKDKMNLS